MTPKMIPIINNATTLSSFNFLKQKHLAKLIGCSYEPFASPIVRPEGVGINGNNYATHLEYCDWQPTEMEK